MAGSVIENVTKLSFASKRMQAAERAHDFVVYFSLQTTSTVVEVLRCWPPFRSPPSDSCTRRRTVAIHHRWYWTLWASTTLGVKSPTDLFVASHWLERSSSRFSVTLLVFSRADHSTSQVLTTFYEVFISTYFWRLASKAPSSSDLWLEYGRDVTRRG